MPATTSARQLQPDTGAAPQRSNGEEAHFQRCRFCTRGASGGVFIDAGGDVGCVQQACFIEWDLRQEAVEATATIASLLADPGELRTELELEVEDPVARAA
jgi:hypothetical protein